MTGREVKKAKAHRSATVATRLHGRERSCPEHPTAFRVVAAISRDSFYGRCGAGEGRRGFSGREGPRRHGDNCFYPLSARHRQANQLPIMAPFEVVNDFAREVLTHAGALIANVLRGSERALLEQLKLDFSGVRRVKPLEAEAMHRRVRIALATEVADD